MWKSNKLIINKSEYDSGNHCWSNRKYIYNNYSSYDYIIESDEVPVVEDFGFTTHSLESPVFDYEYMDKMFYKNQELEKDFEDEWINGKSLDIYVFTLEDVNDGVYDLDEEE